MSFGRHACRQALKPNAVPVHDHLWISDDLLAVTFRRFANGQRRHGSCVPGPLEARRRLAKRRNTVLAAFGAGSADDIACLFGRNGREHMKWTDHPWQRPQAETRGMLTFGFALNPNFHIQYSKLEDHRDYSATVAQAPLSFDDHNHGLVDVFRHSVPRPPSLRAEPISRSDQLKKFLEGGGHGIEEIRDFTRQLRIDLQRFPKYSRQILDYLLSRPVLNMDQVIQFLDDPFLNTWGSGNYYAALRVFVQAKMKRSSRTAVLHSVCRALELGLVPTDELCLILQAMPRILVERGQAMGVADPNAVVKHYRAMWKAIGRCTILGYRDLDSELVNVWLTELLKLRSFRFAEQVIVATHNASIEPHWPVNLVLAQLAEAKATGIEPSFPTMLSQLHPECGAKCIIQVTETLAIPKTKNENQGLLEHWQSCLAKLTNISALANSRAWLDVPLAYSEEVATTELSPPISHVQKQIVSRLWVLRTLSRSLEPLQEHGSRATDLPLYLMLGLYETATKKTSGSFLSDLMRGIHSLNMPHNDLLLLAVNMRLKKRISKTTRQTLERLETSQISLADVWTNPPLYQGVRALFFGAFDQMFRHLDLTSSEMVGECLRLVRVGDSRSIWSVLTILRSHTPLKLCLNKAWTPLPHPDEKALVRYHGGTRNSQTPDPYSAVDFIHRLAVAISCSHNLTPARSFHLVHMLYDYLRRHGGPVYPSLVQAMYHAGIVRYRREGRRISATQYEYILWIVDKFEGREAAMHLRAPARIGVE
ncbi:hypothetical protein PDE_08831 [Penicillium oxalicum 114-2]|uniref:Uncharacterized protein n=1 Tax=Penicillium oxalicum (strain 114-2 / CGMCC 5302) TaxID=933388 RepID=S7ZTY8_PENO1|nr:hypothetical protein PDE_08831 [Penicillium oxalicum 114-2]